MRQAGLTILAGRHWGGRGGRVLEAAGDDVLVQLRGAPDDGDRVRAALAAFPAGARDDPSPILFALSYEACVALGDRRSPRKARDAALGPDVLVRRLVDVTERGGRVIAADGPWRDGAAEADPTLAIPAGARERHVARVRAAREHLLDGVIYQANLAHRLDVRAADHRDGLAFFMDAATSPRGVPPCAAFVDVPGWGSIVSLSPERFVFVEPGANAGANVGAADRVARAFPIKGTRPRGATPAEDARLVRELCSSEKDRAEHVMIVDLLRNDLGKVAVAGGVTVERLLEVISVKNVHHLESTVAARLRPDVTIADVIAATVPGGSITGAPKSSAVDVIHALEDGPRGLYTGVLGLVERGTLRSSLLIRTWLRPDHGAGALHVGGGIVFDSDPDAEWQETLDKAAAFSRVT